MNKYFYTSNECFYSLNKYYGIEALSEFRSGYIELKKKGESEPQFVVYMKTLSSDQWSQVFYNAISKLMIQKRRIAIVIILSDLEKMQKATTTLDGEAISTMQCDVYVLYVF